jgi:putative endonuclease
MNPITFLYVLECADKSYYIGITNNVNRRLEEHSKGIHGKYFLRKSLHPFKLIAVRSYNDIVIARQKEKYFKRLNRQRLLRELEVMG